MFKLSIFRNERTVRGEKSIANKILKETKRSRGGRSVIAEAISQLAERQKAASTVRGIVV